MERDRAVLESLPLEGLTWRERNALKMRNRVGSRFVPTSSNALLERLMTMSSPERSPSPKREDVVSVEVTMRQQPRKTRRRLEGTDNSSSQPKSRQKQRKPSAQPESDDPLASFSLKAPKTTTSKRKTKEQTMPISKKPSSSAKATKPKARPALASVSRSSRRRAESASDAGVSDNDINSRKPRGRSRSRKPLHSSSPVHTDPDTASCTSRRNRTINCGGSKADTVSRGGAHEIAGTSEDDLNLKGPSSKRQAKKGFSRAFEPRKLLPQHPLSPVVEGASFDSSHSTTRGSVKHTLSTPDVAHSSSEAKSDKILTVVEDCMVSPSARRIAVSEGDDYSTSRKYPSRKFDEKTSVTKPLSNIMKRCPTTNDTSHEEAHIQLPVQGGAGSTVGNHNATVRRGGSQRKLRPLRAKSSTTTKQRSERQSPTGKGVGSTPLSHASQLPQDRASSLSLEKKNVPHSFKVATQLEAGSPDTEYHQPRDSLANSRQPLSAPATVSLRCSPPLKRVKPVSISSNPSARQNMVKKGRLNEPPAVEDSDSDALIIPMPKRLKRALLPVASAAGPEEKSSQKVVTDQKATTLAHKLRQHPTEVFKVGPDRSPPNVEEVLIANMIRPKVSHSATLDRDDDSSLVRSRKRKAVRTQRSASVVTSVTDLEINHEETLFSTSSTVVNSEDRSSSPYSSGARPPLKKKRTSLAEVRAEARDLEAEKLNRQVDHVSVSYVNSVSPVVPHGIKGTLPHARGKARASRNPVALKLKHGDVFSISPEPLRARNNIKKPARGEPMSEDDPLNLLA